MATVTKPVALDESLNTTDSTPKNIADVLKDKLGDIASAISGGGGGSGGHTIQNASGANMPQETTMQFKDSHVTDNSQAGKTEVEVIKSVASADYSSETEDGLYLIPDGDGSVIEPASEDYVEVTADGTKTYSQILDGMYADADITKLSNNSFLRIGNDIYSVDGEWRFSRGRTSNSNFNNTSIEFKASGSKVYSYNGTTVTDVSSTLVTDGVIFVLYYGNRKAVVDLQTTANRCWYDSNTTVKQKLDVTDVTVTPVNGNITAGGVKRQGNLIVINIRYVSTSATAVGDAIVTFPYDITSTTAHVSLANSQNYSIDLLGNRIRTNTAIASGVTIMISGAVFVE